MSLNERVNHFEELAKFINDEDIDKECFCILGSSILAEKKLRENKDIDLAMSPDQRSKIDLGDLPPNIDIALEKYSWLDINDKALLQNENYWYKIEGYKFLRPELVYSYKQRRRWDKDKKDLNLIENFLINGEAWDWDWGLFNYEYYPKERNKRGIPASKSDRRSFFFRIARSIEYRGFFVSVKHFLSTRIIKPNKGEQSRERGQTIYFIIWPTAFGQKTNIINRIDSTFEVSNEYDLNLDNISGFVDEVYSYNKTEILLEFKKQKISNIDSKIAVVEAEFRGNLDVSLEQFLSGFKDDIRKEFYPYVSNDSFHNIIHGPDELEENKWIEQVIQKHKS